MKILILGCGQVGSAIAEELAAMPSNDVTIVDTDEQALKNIASRLDVQTLVGNAASPVLLEQAGAPDTDMLLALTRSDETNLVACKLAATLFNIPQRIARVRNSAYQEYGETDQDPDTLSASLKAFDITDSIHPEHLLTEHIAGLLSYVRALQVLPFAHDKVRMVVAEAKAEDWLVGKSLVQINAQLGETLDCQISAIYRNTRLIVPQPETVIEEGDEIAFMVDSKHMAAVMYVLFEYNQSNHRVMIAGGGNVGFRLAKKMEHKFNIKIIEEDAQRAEWLAEQLDNTLVLYGSATDESLLTREYINEIDVFCALTNDDENNIMAGLLAKNLGAKRVISVINRARYVDLLTGNSWTSSFRRTKSPSAACSPMCAAATSPPSIPCGAARRKSSKPLCTATAPPHRWWGGAWTKSNGPPPATSPPSCAATKSSWGGTTTKSLPTATGWCCSFPAAASRANWKN